MVASSNKSPCCTVELAIDCRPARVHFHPSRGDGRTAGVKIILNFHLVFLSLGERRRERSLLFVLCTLFDDIL